MANNGVEIAGVKSVVQSLRDRAKRQPTYTDLQVGYSASYAIYVHENLEAHHPIGQAKYLESAVRQYSGRVADIVRTEMSKPDVDLTQALMKGGEFLLAESKKLVPVDTGFLRDSGYIHIGRRIG